MSLVVEVVPLGEAVKPSRPRVKPSNYPELPFIGMEHIEAHSMKLLGTVPAKTMKSSAVHFKPGDVLYGRLRPYLNKVYRPSFEGLCSAEFIVLPENERVDGAYLQYFLNSAEFVRYASHLNTGDRPRVDFEQLAPYDLPLPRKEEQRWIVAEIEKHFSRLHDAVDILKRVAVSAERYKASVLNAAVEGRLVPIEAKVARRERRSYETGAQLLQRILAQRSSRWRSKGKSKEPAMLDETDLPSLPEGWVWTTFEQVSERVTKGSSPNWQGFEYCSDGIPFVRSQNVGWGQIDLTDLAFLPRAFNDVEKKSVLCEGDVLLNIVGASIGRAAIAPRIVEGGNINQAVAVIRLQRCGVNNRFALAYLLSAAAQRHIHSQKVDVARANYSLQDIKNMPFALPPLAEQDRIVAEVERQLSVTVELEATTSTNLQRASRFFQSILRQVFSGRHD